MQDMQLGRNEKSLTWHPAVYLPRRRIGGHIASKNRCWLTSSDMLSTRQLVTRTSLW